MKAPDSEQLQKASEGLRRLAEMATSWHSEPDSMESMAHSMTLMFCCDVQNRLMALSSPDFPSFIDREHLLNDTRFRVNALAFMLGAVLGDFVPPAQTEEVQNMIDVIGHSLGMTTKEEYAEKIEKEQFTQAAQAFLDQMKTTPFDT